MGLVIEDEQFFDGATAVAFAVDGAAGLDVDEAIRWVVVQLVNQRGAGIT